MPKWLTSATTGTSRSTVCSPVIGTRRPSGFCSGSERYSEKAERYRGSLLRPPSRRGVQAADNLCAVEKQRVEARISRVAVEVVARVGGAGRVFVIHQQTDAIVRAADALAGTLQPPFESVVGLQQFPEGFIRCLGFR